MNRKAYIPLLVCVSLVSRTGFSSSEYEGFVVSPAKLSASDLKAVIGSMTFACHSGQSVKSLEAPLTKGIDSFQRNTNGEWKTKEKVNVGVPVRPDEHLPPAITVSGMDGSCDLGGRVRYPVVAAEGDYVQIISNQFKGTKIWVKKSDGEDLIYFDDLAKKPQELYVGLFLLRGLTTVRVYGAPDRKARFISIKRPESASPKELPKYDTQRFRILDQKGQWIRIAEENHPLEEDPVILKKKKVNGWVPVRDEDGTLAIWVYNVGGSGC